MAFTRKEQVKSVPTHLKWILANPEMVGSTHEIVTILFNADWRTVTFFTKEFKANIKAEEDKEYLETRDEVYKNLKRGYCKAEITDTSNLEQKIYSFDVVIDSIPINKGGRRFELNKNRISIRPSTKEEKA